MMSSGVYSRSREGSGKGQYSVLGSVAPRSDSGLQSALAESPVSLAVQARPAAVGRAAQATQFGQQQSAEGVRRPPRAEGKRERADEHRVGQAEAEQHRILSARPERASTVAPIIAVAWISRNSTSISSMPLPTPDSPKATDATHSTRKKPAVIASGRTESARAYCDLGSLDAASLKPPFDITRYLRPAAGFEDALFPTDPERRVTAAHSSPTAAVEC
jgi:hypothetical protein